MKEIRHYLGAPLIFAGLVSAFSLNAATINVTSLDDDGTGCTLRESVDAINNRLLPDGCINLGEPFGTGDRIVFDGTIIDSTIRLSMGEIPIIEPLTIDTEGAPITIDAGGQSRHFNCSDVEYFKIDGLSLENGLVLEDGGSIHAYFCPMTLRRARLIRNSAGNRGGALHLEFSELTLEHTTVDSNASGSHGSAISSQPARVVSISDSEITNNISHDQIHGVAVFLNGVTSATITDSLLAGNNAVAVMLLSANLAILNSTFSENHGFLGGSMRLFSGSQNEGRVKIIIERSDFLNNSAHKGGVIYAENGASIEINESIVANNTATSEAGFLVGGSSDLKIVNTTFSGQSISTEITESGVDLGVFGFLTRAEIINSTFADSRSVADSATIFVDTNGTLDLFNSIVASSSMAIGCLTDGGSVIANTDSIIQNDACSSGARSAEPQLLPISDNGGRTLTHAIMQSSPAWNTGTDVGCPSVDQRGSQRDDGKCDVGAFELSDVIF